MIYTVDILSFLAAEGSMWIRTKLNSKCKGQTLLMLQYANIFPWLNKRTTPKITRKTSSLFFTKKHSLCLGEQYTKSYFNRQDLKEFVSGEIQRIIIIWVNIVMLYEKSSRCDGVEECCHKNQYYESIVKSCEA